MEDILTKYLVDLNPTIIIASIIILIFLCWIIIKNRKVITDFFNDLYNQKKRKEEILQTIKNNQSAIKEIMNNRARDREQSLSIQKELTDAQNKLSESLSDISKKIDNMQHNTDERFKESERKNNKRIRAELKDKISQSYRYYHSLGKINDMELEALEDLIEEYESAEGQNSFVHSVVQKEMYTWEKVSQI
jgi:DNA anti-recombination protein RmuC